MGGGASKSERRAQQQREEQRRRQQAQQQHQQQQQRRQQQEQQLQQQALQYNYSSGSRIPNHLLQQQPESFRRQHQESQSQALMQLQRLMMAMTQQGGGQGGNRMMQPAVQAVTEGRTITNDCAVNTFTFEFNKDTSQLSFNVVNRVPCEVECHVAVRLDVYQGICFATPNRQRAPPKRVQITEPHSEGFECKFTLDEPYATIPEKERTYSMHAPKQFPVVISVLYSSTPESEKERKAAAVLAAATAPGSTATPHEQLKAVQALKDAKNSKPDFDESTHREQVAARRAEHTCLQLDPSLKMVRQFFELEGGTYLVEHLYGGEHEGRVISDEAASNSEKGVDAEASAGSVIDPNNASNMVDADGDDDDTCVICLTDERTTAVMPCRHLCLCKECAEELRKRSPKCPVCRGPIQQLLAMKKRNTTSPSTSPTTSTAV